MTDSDPNALIATERFMVENKDVIKIGSDIMVAPPHHGANNGSSTAFIEAVSPKFVIFPAGSKHKHPTSSAAQRYLDNGVIVANMFRTDRGDRIRVGEWNHLSTVAGGDVKGDDDVDIVLHANGSAPLMEYHQP
jgi:competence protein ComEC